MTNTQEHSLEQVNTTTGKYEDVAVASKVWKQDKGRLWGMAASKYGLLMITKQRGILQTIDGTVK